MKKVKLKFATAEKFVEFKKYIHTPLFIVDDPELTIEGMFTPYEINMGSDMFHAKIVEGNTVQIPDF